MKKPVERVPFCAHCGGEIKGDDWKWCAVEVPKAPMQKVHKHCAMGLRWPWLETSMHNRKLAEPK